MEKQKREFQILPICELYEDPDFKLNYLTPRETEEKLEKAIKRFGLLGTIVVDTQPNGYRIVDVLRCYRAAKSLGIESALCCVHPPLTESEFCLLRYQLNNFEKPWPKKTREAVARKLVKSGLLKADEI